MWDEIAKIEASLAETISALHRLRSSMRNDSEIDDVSSTHTLADSLDDNNLDKESQEILSKSKDFWYYYNEARNKHDNYEIWVNAIDAYLTHELLRYRCDEAVVCQYKNDSRVADLRCIPLLPMKEASKMIAAMENCVAAEGNRAVQAGLIDLKSTWRDLLTAKISQEEMLCGEIERLNLTSATSLDGLIDSIIPPVYRSKYLHDHEKCLVSHMWVPLHSFISCRSDEGVKNLTVLLELWRTSKNDLVSRFGAVSVACGHLLKMQYINFSKLQRVQQLYLKTIDHYSELFDGNLIVLFGPTGVG